MELQEVGHRLGTGDSSSGIVFRNMDPELDKSDSRDNKENQDIVSNTHKWYLYIGNVFVTWSCRPVKKKEGV